MTLALLLLSAVAVHPRGWADAREPFHVVGNVYSVGSAEVTSFLIATPKGHVLIDGGFPESGPQIARNIDKLGFKLEDVKVLLVSHAHIDHAGGLAELKRRTGAQVVASRADAEAMARGGKGDPQFGDSIPFAPVYADRIVQDGGVVRVGPTELVAHVTPGHTQGCTTWTTVQREDEQPLHVVFNCSMSVPEDYRLLGNPRYPRAVDDYERSFRTLRALPCDVLLGPHASFFQQDERRARMRDGAPNPFVDPAACGAYLDRSEQAFRAHLERERAAPPPPPEPAAPTAGMPPPPPAVSASRLR
ncbi:MAG: subclass B3 metallo-beta-lactamase [Deltaproteobacteria bacterium]|nr:MAG: subclass B3 metallo-beta-lactamase [Deltaproteobacteria bacterium]